MVSCYIDFDLIFDAGDQDAVRGRSEDEIRRERDDPRWEAHGLQMPVHSQTIGTIIKKKKQLLTFEYSLDVVQSMQCYE